MYLAKAAKIVRKEILDHPQTFTGTFASGCEDKSIPPSLRALITMILEESPTRQQQNTEDKEIQSSHSC